VIGKLNESLIENILDDSIAFFHAIIRKLIAIFSTKTDITMCGECGGATKTCFS
jgi:hypothetical protein